MNLLMAQIQLLVLIFRLVLMKRMMAKKLSPLLVR
jgi:hypothetical protein